MKNKLILIYMCLSIFAFGCVSIYAQEIDPNSGVDSATEQNQTAQVLVGQLIGLNVTVFGNDGTACGIGISNIKGRDYLFLPSSASLKGLTLNFDESKYSVELVNSKTSQKISSGSSVNISNILGKEEADGSRQLLMRLTDANGVTSEGVVYVMKSANIASIHIGSVDPTKDRTFIEQSKSNSARASMVMLSNNGSTVYAGGLSQIRGRGNTTFAGRKKPYQIKLDTDTDLIETGKEKNASKTWILLANAYDPTMVHNTVSLDIANAYGCITPDHRAVDLYYDGVYRGNYLLTEKVEIGSGRVDIKNLEKSNKKANEGKDLDKLKVEIGKNKYGDTISYVTGMNNPKDITGGYLLELDVAYYKEERSYFILSDGTAFVVKSPDNASKEQVEYISDYMEEMIRLAKAGGTNEETGVSVWDYIDKDSLVTFFTLQEVVKNADGFASSTFFYKDAGSKMYAGPVWDFDDSFGIRADVAPIENLVICSEFINTFIGVPDFRTGVKQFYNKTGYTKASGVNINNIVSQISASQKMNRILWNDEGQVYQKLGTYDEDVAYMKNYAAGRYKWLKTEFANW